MNKNRRLNVALFIVLPILSIIIGYLGMKVYLSVNDTPARLIELSNSVDEMRHIMDEETTGESSPENNEIVAVTEPQSKVNHVFKGISINCIQIGSFSNLESATKLADELRRNGFGYFVHSGEKKRVITEAYLSKDAATQRLSQIKKIFRDAYIVTFELDDINIDFDATEDQLSEIKEFSLKMDGTLTGLNTMMVSIGLEESSEALKTMIEEELVEFNNLSSRVAQQNIDETSYTYKTMNDCANKTISIYSSLVEDLDNKGQSKAVYWEGVLSIYFQYIDFLEDL